MNTYLETLETTWRATALQMSYFRADDSAREWGHATALRPLLQELEKVIKSYGGDRPDGSGYLISAFDRIAWPVRHCDDCDFQTTMEDVVVCPDSRCKGSVG